MLIAILILVVIGRVALSNKAVVKADGIESAESYTYSIVTNSKGEESYSVAIKSTAKPSVEIVVIPETHEGLKVTEIANNGFMSCANLKKVILPTTIEKIGNNAFMNCAKLERISLPSVESIGMNAFAMCPLLDRMYIPSSVKTVGANILRNNANTLYIQSSEEKVNSEWQTTWNNYFTGDIKYDFTPEATIQYREILDESEDKVIGYELAENQFINAATLDLVIYNSFRPDESSEYLPVYNICSDAFTFSLLNSITIKDRRVDDLTAPSYTHKINVMSNAFYMSFVNEVSFEIGVTFDHTAKSTMSENSGIEIVGDKNNNSTKIFEGSEIHVVKLPAGINFIPDRMFCDCTYLDTIICGGQANNEINILNSIRRIGDCAFSACINLAELTIPSSVEEVGESVFYEWGNGENPQIININDFYEGFLPEGWAENWFEGNELKTTINYKNPTYIAVDYQDDIGTTISIGVKPGLEMPALEKPIRKGYIFKGIYSKMDSGLQYYTDDMTVNRNWEEGDPTTIYVHWEKEIYNITYTTDVSNLPYYYPKTYSVTDEIFLESVDYEGYRYTFTPDYIPVGSTDNIEITVSKIKLKLLIKYDLDDWKGCTNPNPETYDATQEVVFINLEHEGYTFTWSPASIPVGTTEEEFVVKGTWTPIKYNITYKTHGNTTHQNPSEYPYSEYNDFVLSAPVCGGYFASWDKDRIPAGTIGDITITAIYIEKTLNQCYNNGVYEIWTNNQFQQLADQPNGGFNQTYLLCDDIWSGGISGAMPFNSIPEFKGTLDGNGHKAYQYSLDTSEGGNIGFCKENYGEIRNLTLAFTYYVSEDLKNVNIGVFAGTNYGIISNCSVSITGNRPSMQCYAKGDSYAGCFVGVNKNIIEYCYGGEWLHGSCNMGVIAGLNSGSISHCEVGNQIHEIIFKYRDYNACVGGIAGKQIADGLIFSCSYLGRIGWSSDYKSSKYSNWNENREMQPCIGIMLGYIEGGLIKGSSWKSAGILGSTVVYAQTPPVKVTWKQSGKTQTHDQGLYFKNEECGRIA